MSRPIIGKVVPAPGTGPGWREDPLAKCVRDLQACRKQRDEAIGLLKMWRKQRSVRFGVIEYTTDAFLLGIDQESKDTP